MNDLRFLVVDDSATMRRIVINSLKRIGVEDVVEAADGKDALAKMYSENISFIITDWNMPEMNGLEFVKALKEDDAFKDLPILMVTTRSVKDDIIDAMKAGVNSYVVKPFTPEVLKGKIEQVLKG